MRIIVMELGMLKRSRLIDELSFGRVSFCVVFFLTLKVEVAYSFEDSSNRFPFLEIKFYS